MTTEIAVYVPDAKEQTRNSKRVYVCTPYQCAKAVNAMLKAAGINKEIPPQMLYTYARKGKFLTYEAFDGSGRIEVDRDSFGTWVQGYISKLLKK